MKRSCSWKIRPSVLKGRSGLIVLGLIPIDNELIAVMWEQGDIERHWSPLLIPRLDFPPSVSSFWSRRRRSPLFR